jgi:hypothetical protein
MAVDLTTVGEAEGTGTALLAVQAYLEEARDLQSDDEALDALTQAYEWLGLVKADLVRDGLTEMAGLADQAGQAMATAISEGVTGDLATWQSDVIPNLQGLVAAIVMVPAEESFEAREEVSTAGWRAFAGLVGAGVVVLGTAAWCDYRAARGDRTGNPHVRGVVSVRYG